MHSIVSITKFFTNLKKKFLNELVGPPDIEWKSANESLWKLADYDYGFTIIIIVLNASKPLSGSVYHLGRCYGSIFSW